MRHARRFIAIIAGVAAWCRAAATTAYARVPDPPYVPPGRAERVPHVTKTHKRLGNRVRRLISLLAMAIIVGAATVPAASALPQDPNAFVLAQNCTDGTGTILTLHPGVGKALWDVTTEVVSRAPSYLIKSVDQDVYVNDVFIGHFTYRFGQKVGLGDEFTCTYTETFTTPDGGVLKVLGTGVKVRL